MKIFKLFALMVVLAHSGAVFAETPPASADSPARQGCRMIDVHCQCVNPTKDFVVENQKLGRINPGEPGECKPKAEVDASAEKMPIAYCLKGESVKDERKGESKCTATWTCKETCTLK